MRCKYAWTHLDFKTGGYAPCFRFKRHGLKDSGTDKLPSEVINNSDFVRVREELASGIWPKGCVDCKIQEESGIESYRQRSLYNKNVRKADYSTNIIKIKDLQLKLSRACNYNCRHCDSGSNSSFEKIGIKFPEIETKLSQEFEFNHITKAKNKIAIPSKEVMDDLFVNVIPWVETIEFSGGEPFYSIEMYKTLERMIEDPLIDTSKITLMYNTNMSLLEYKGYNVKNYWYKFKSIRLTVSMDGTGDLFNYFRTGGDWDTVVNNIKEVSPMVDNFLFVCTTSSYQAFYMNEIYRDLTNLKDSVKGPLIKLRATFVHWPKVLDIVNLEDEVKLEILENTEVNEFTQPFIDRIKGERTAAPRFKQLVIEQDKLYNIKESGKIHEYVYGTND